MNKKLYLISTIFFVIILLVGKSDKVRANPEKIVYEIAISETIDPGLYTFVSRGISEAEENSADAIIFRIDTYGGLADSGIKIKDEIFRTYLPSYTFVSNRAWSAGALIALAGNKLAMTNGSSIGAAETRPNEEKYISALRKEFGATAERRGKDQKIAEAMVDSSIAIEGLIETDKLLSLTAEEALEVGISDYLVRDVRELLNKADLENARIVQITMSPAEKLARIVTNPYVSITLLTVAFLAFILEAIAPGWGVGGTIGVLSLGLFFTGYSITGDATTGLITLFIAGLILILLEIFVVPGFGVTGIGGLAAVLISLFLVFPTTETALTVMTAVIFLSVIGTALAVKKFGASKIWSRISLTTEQTNSGGYVSSENRKNLLGKEGVTITKLRPSGTIDVEGERLSVVSEGNYIEEGVPVEITKVSGSRIVVRLKNKKGE